MAATDGTGPNRERAALSDTERNLVKVTNGNPTGHVDLLKYARDAERINTQFMGQLRARWERNYKAYRSEHFLGSKYRLKQWEGRSKLFRPKTRSAVRSAMTVAAEAMFSTADIVTISATRESDPVQLASAKVLQECLNYRLDRTSPRGGMPWFQITMASVFNATVTGVSVSKQYWDYQTKKRVGVRLIPKLDEMGKPMLEPATGQPLMVQDTTPQTIVSADRPMCDVIPTENVMVDLAAPWYAPAQSSAYFVVRYPMLVGDLKQMTRNADKPGANTKAGVQWLSIEDAALKSVQEDYDAMGVRLARSGGEDPKNPRRSEMDGEYGIVWVHENFFRYQGEDYHFWSIGTDIYASTPMLTEDAYPHLKGERPYVFGYGAIEPHMVFPMSAVESWQPLQQEANDVVNLRLDSLKQAIEPIAKVKRGSMLDMTQLQPGRRGAPGSVVQVNAMDDLDFAQWPGPRGEAYAEMQNINADFDDLAGVFSGSSVNTNRNLNETVGGMRLLNASAGSVKEFDLRVWVETCVEPILRQIVRLEQYYESDEDVLAIAGERAKIWQRFGVNELTDEHLTKEVTVRVNVGIGASDPMQKIQKMQMGLTMIGGLVPFFDRPVRVKADEMVNEIFGMIGQKDGERFFTFGEVGEGMGGGGEEAAAQAEAQTKVALEEMRGKLELQLAQMNNASAEERERMKGQIQLLTTMLSLQGRQQEQQVAQQGAERSNAFQHMSKMMIGEQQGSRAERIAKTKTAATGTGKAGGQSVAVTGGGPRIEDDGSSQMLDQIGNRLGQIVQGMSMIGKRIGELDAAIEEISRSQRAPVELVRDSSGRAVGVKRDGKVRQIQRDPRTNRPQGLM